MFTDSQVEHVLTIPLQAVVGSVEMGNKRKCYVMTPHGAEEREVTLGLSNDKMVEVKDGLEEGEEVVVNPRSLMSEKERSAAAPKGPGGPEDGKGYPGGGEGKGWPGAGGDKKGPFPGGGADKKGPFPGGDMKGGMMKGGPAAAPGKTEGQ
jgi:hypothetical protein